MYAITSKLLYAYNLRQRKIQFSMYLYEYIFIFLTGAAIGLIVRYIAGYKKRIYPYVACNLLTGGIGCIISAFTGGVTYMQIFISGISGIVGNFIYTATRCIISLF